jgi:hypothetical protein
METNRANEAVSKSWLHEDIDAIKVASYGYDLGAGEWRRFAIDRDGKILMSTFKEYEFTDIGGTDPMYIGYTAKGGNWFIKKYSKSAGTMRFFKGDSGYTTAWTGRAGLTYDYFYEIFGS